MTNQTLYSLVQCTPDLSGTDCNNCLQDAIKILPSCCSGKQGGRIVFPSCNLRYELYQFYETVATVPPPSPGTLEHQHQIPVDCLSFLIIRLLLLVNINYFVLLSDVMSWTSTALPSSLILFGYCKNLVR